MDILVQSSFIRRKDMDTVLNCLVSDRLNPADYATRLMKMARERLGFDYGLPLRSPMNALSLAFSALGLKAGDHVAISALDPPWVHKTIVADGFEVVWLDVDESSALPSTIGIDKARLAGCKALYLSERWGMVPDPAPYRDSGMYIIEDISHSLGGNAGGIPAGTIGTLTMLGLEPASSITGGGGAILYATGKREGQALKNAAETVLNEEKMTDMNAALALSQLRDLDKFLARRAEIAAVYEQSLIRAHRKRLTGFDGMIQGGETGSSSMNGSEQGERMASTLTAVKDGDSSASSHAAGSVPERMHANFGCVIVLDSSVKDVRAYARKKDVDTVMAFEDSCIMLGMVPEGSCPVAASLANRCVAFPLNQRIGKTSAQKIARVLATLP